MMWIAVPLIITWLWTSSTLFKKGWLEGLSDLVTAAVLTGTTSWTLWTVSQAPPDASSLIKDRPDLATVVMVALILSLVAMFWLAKRRGV